MIVDQPIHPLAQRDQPCRGEDTRLPHPAAHHLAVAARPIDRVLRTDQQRANRCGESLRQAEGQRIGPVRELCRVAPQRDRGVEDPRTVDVDAQTVRVRHLEQCRQFGEVEHRAARCVVGVLDRQQPRVRVVHVLGPHRTHQLLRLDLAATADDRPHGQATQAGGAADFRIGDVRADLGDDLVTWLCQAELGQQVALGAAGYEEARFLLENARRLGLQLVNARVFAKDVVADRCIGHRLTHRGRRLSDRVAPKIEPQRCLELRALRTFHCDCHTWPGVYRRLRLCQLRCCVRGHHVHARGHRSV